MKKIFEIIRIDNLSVVTRAGSYCRDRDDETEYIEVGTVVAAFNTHVECENWIVDFCHDIEDIRSEMRTSNLNKNGYWEISRLAWDLIAKFGNKFIYINDRTINDCFKFEIRTRYTTD